MNYSYGSYNDIGKKYQTIRLTEGCPHNCPYCYEPQEFKIFEIPKIVRNHVRIVDMNLLAKPEALGILKSLPERLNNKIIEYEAVCGIDYRFITPEIVNVIKTKRFKKIRIAWDWWYKDQYKIKDAINMLTFRAYKPEQIMIFMIVNWKIPYSECCKKMDLCKIWNVQVADCRFDNQTKTCNPEYWSVIQMRSFRRKCRKHNQLVNFKIDPEVAETKRII